MAKRIIWTCDICGNTVLDACNMYQITFTKCKVDGEYLEEVREEDSYQVCTSCIKNAHAIFTNYLHNKAESSKKAIENYKKKGSGLATC